MQYAPVPRAEHCEVEVQGSPTRTVVGVHFLLMQEETPVTHEVQPVVLVPQLALKVPGLQMSVLQQPSQVVKQLSERQNPAAQLPPAGHVLHAWPKRPHAVGLWFPKRRHWLFWQHPSEQLAGVQLPTDPPPAPPALPPPPAVPPPKPPPPKPPPPPEPPEPPKPPKPPPKPPKPPPGPGIGPPSGSRRGKTWVRPHAAAATASKASSAESREDTWRGAYPRIEGCRICVRQAGVPFGLKKH